MAEPSIPEKAKLFVGIISGDEKLIYHVQERLKKKFGDIDGYTSPIVFTHTTYYQKIGAVLYKVFYSFDKLVKREDIVKIKLYTNSLEKKFSPKGQRRVNIDPGYLTLSNVYLASCKDYFHRTYLSKGVYLENEYRYFDRQYRPWEWTYPDYKKKEYLDFFHNTRNTYYRQIRKSD